MAVFVLDRKGRPLMPCCEKRATKLLSAGRARVHRLTPFVIRLIDRQLETSVLQPLEVKLDPGSKFTGIAVVRVSEQINRETGEIQKAVQVLSLLELMHRGKQISEALTSRRAMRRARRNRKTRYRAPRFLNRGNKQRGWLAPSLQHRVDTTCAWVKRLQRWAPITQIAQELVRFDMQKMQAQAQGGDMVGAEYQQGTLLGYEVREYLLEKFNRCQLEVPKTHALDAACVGVMASLTDWQKPTLNIKCTGRGSYQRTQLDQYGFPRGYLMRSKSVHGFQTGDRVQAQVTKGTKIGCNTGRVAVRASGSFNIQTSAGLVQGISHRYCKVIQRADGYGYSQVAKIDVTGTPPQQGMRGIPRSTSPA